VQNCAYLSESIAHLLAVNCLAVGIFDFVRLNSMALLTACKLAAASFDTYFVGEGDFTIVCWSDVLNCNADWSLSLLFSHAVDLSFLC